MNKNQFDVVIEVSRGDFLKRRGDGTIAFLSPIPSPFNYGALAGITAEDADEVDAIVLGERLKRGTRLSLPVVGVVHFTDAGAEDDKYICGRFPSKTELAAINLFFKIYARLKTVLNRAQSKPGKTTFTGFSALSEPPSWMTKHSG